MRRDDQTHIAVGIGLFVLGLAGVAGVLGVIYDGRTNPNWATVGLGAVAGIFVTLIPVGIYMTLAVYRGWWLPKTNSERENEPDVRIGDVRQVTAPFKIDGVFFEVPLINSGRGDLSLSLNLLVPHYEHSIARVVRRSEMLSRTPASTSESLTSSSDGTPIGSIYWHETDLSLPSRMTTILMFVVGTDQLRDIPMKVKVIGGVLPDDLVRVVTLQIDPALLNRSNPFPSA